MGKVVKLEVERQAAVAPGMQAGACSGSHEISPLTPALKEFIDRAIVPGLLCLYLAEKYPDDILAVPISAVGESAHGSIQLRTGVLGQVKR